ncbi:MAG: hypothetical protein Q8K86_00235 [Candidatus Nanopelagicaceae bacterium]|nr:hypothetical protein [Candidatus Nanopelagicaceae bacterium]
MEVSIESTDKDRPCNRILNDWISNPPIKWCSKPAVLDDKCLGCTSLDDLLSELEKRKEAVVRMEALVALKKESENVG